MVCCKILCNNPEKAGYRFSSKVRRCSAEGGGGECKIHHILSIRK